MCGVCRASPSHICAGVASRSRCCRCARSKPGWALLRTRLLERLLGLRAPRQHLSPLQHPSPLQPQRRGAAGELGGGGLRGPVRCNHCLHLPCPVRKGGLALIFPNEHFWAKENHGEKSKNHEPNWCLQKPHAPETFSMTTSIFCLKNREKMDKTLEKLSFVGTPSHAFHQKR